MEHHTISHYKLVHTYTSTAILQEVSCVGWLLGFLVRIVMVAIAWRILLLLLLFLTHYRGLKIVELSYSWSKHNFSVDSTKLHINWPTHFIVIL